MIKNKEKNLYDLWTTIRRGRRTVAVVTTGCVLVSFLLAFWIAPRYEATAIVRVGESPIGNPGEASAMTAIEPPGDVVARIKSRSFLASAAKALKVDPDHFEKAVSLSVVRGTSLIEVRLRAEEREASAERLQRIVDMVSAKHQELVRPYILHAQENLADIEIRISDVEAQRADLAKHVLDPKLSEKQFSEYVLLMSAYLGRDAELAALRQRAQRLKAALDLATVRPTASIEPIHVSSRPVSPRRGLLLAMGLLAGVVFGAFWVIATQAWRDLKVHARVGNP